MAQLRMYVFGPPRLERDGATLEFGLRRALALLVFLAVRAQPHSRDALATLLWPDSDHREARARLRRTLYRLTQVLGNDLLAVDADTVAVAATADLRIDCVAFGQLITSRDGLAEAITLYHDDFLAGFTLPDCPAYDEWQFFERERLRQLLARGLEQLVQQASADSAWDAATAYARRRVALDPLHEPAQRTLLATYACAGQIAAARRQYQELVRLLDAELGTKP